MKQLLSKLLVATTILALAACSSGTTTPTPTSNPASGGKIKIENWPAQTGTVKLQLGFPNSAGDVAQASIAADGSGEYTLPTPPAAYISPVKDTLAEIGCTQAITVVPSDAKITRPFFFNAYLGTATTPSGMTMLSSAQPTSDFKFPVGFKFAQNVYADKDVAITGTFTCSSSPSRTINVSFKAGWNFLVTEVKGVSNLGAPNNIDWSASTTEPNGLKWYYMVNPGQ